MAPAHGRQWPDVGEVGAMDDRRTRDHQIGDVTIKGTRAPIAAAARQRRPDDLRQAYPEPGVIGTLPARGWSTGCRSMA